MTPYQLCESEMGSCTDDQLKMLRIVAVAVDAAADDEARNGQEAAEADELIG